MKFSVVIPTYNRGAQTIAAVTSALAQRRPDIDVEVIVVDDGSSDGSKGRVQEAFCVDPVLVLANQRKKGPAGARNTGIAEAKGDYVALLDSDDVFLSDHLSDCSGVFSRHAEVAAVFGRALYEQDGLPVPYMGPNFERKHALAPATHAERDVTVMTDAFFDHLLEYGCYFNLSTVVLRADAAREMMNESLRIAEDYEFWVRLSRQYRFACIDKPQVRYSLHDTNISFETAGFAAEHAPHLLQAYEIMLGYPGLDRSQCRMIERHVADVLFCWAYRCQQRQQWVQAAGLHARSFRHGMRMENVLALLKLAVRCVIARIASAR